MQPQEHNTSLRPAYHLTPLGGVGMAHTLEQHQLDAQFGQQQQAIPMDHIPPQLPHDLDDVFVSAGASEPGFSPRNGSYWPAGTTASSMGSGGSTSTKKRRRGGSGDGSEEDAEKRKKKLERNREIARQSRSRKREHAQALEEENARLRELNRRLELELKQYRSQIGMPTAGRSGRDEQEEIKRAADVKHIEQLTKVRASDADILNRLNYYKETYSDFGEERRALVDVHLRQLKTLMLPNQVTKMMLWLFMQDESFYDTKKKGGMWNMLIKELNLNETQVEKVMEQRNIVTQQRQKLPRSLELMKELSIQLQEDFKARRQTMERFDKILTTTQEAKFLVWVENNKACIHMLNSMWMNVEGTTPDGAPLVVKEEVKK